MADLSQLFQVAPLTAGYMTGENHAMDREVNALKQQELAQTLQKLRMEMEQSQQMNPLKMEYQRLLNAQSGAQTNDFNLSAQQRAFNLKKAQDALPGEQAEAARKGREGARKEKDDALNSATKALHQMGVVFSGPEPFPGAHAASLRQGLEERLGANHPLVKNIMRQVEKVGPGQLGAFFKNLAVQAKEQDPKYLGKMDEVREKEAGDDRRAKLQAGATVQSAQIRANAQQKKQDAVSVIQAVASGKVPPERAMAAYQAAAAIEQNSEMKALYETLMGQLEQYMKNKAAAGMTGKADPKSVGVETVPQTPRALVPTTSGVAPAAPVTGRLKSGNSFTIEQTK